MKYDLDKSIEILQKTPAVLRQLLQGLDGEWLMNNEGPDTFSPFDVLGHLVHGEKTDWTARIKMILDHGETKAFDQFDRFAMYEECKGKTLNDLLDEFDSLRKQNIEWLRSLSLTHTDLDKKGLHPVLGEVTLENLLATWTVHDLTHIAQISRVMAKQYEEAIGPWTEFFRILHF
jgi:hypothetical protein